eukprot:TRINITY_DN32164_c0_g1_i1.p1 TRINITY_DN32164_c0_g1~~TRINITY_DN32164_c0_g1_i1.p1  ORF type:complete len:460 (-),score=63.36 TRINITY_DN32164_c0_g1_i1:24-1403(-)
MNLCSPRAHCSWIRIFLCPCLVNLGRSFIVENDMGNSTVDAPLEGRDSAWAEKRSSANTAHAAVAPTDGAIAPTQAARRFAGLVSLEVTGRRRARLGVWSSTHKLFPKHKAGDGRQVNIARDTRAEDGGRVANALKQNSQDNGGQGANIARENSRDKGGHGANAARVERGEFVEQDASNAKSESGEDDAGGASIAKTDRDEDLGRGGHLPQMLVDGNRREEDGERGRKEHSAKDARTAKKDCDGGGQGSHSGRGLVDAASRQEGGRSANTAKEDRQEQGRRGANTAKEKRDEDGERQSHSHKGLVDVGRERGAENIEEDRQANSRRGDRTAQEDRDEDGSRDGKTAKEDRKEDDGRGSTTATDERDKGGERSRTTANENLYKDARREATSQEDFQENSGRGAIEDSTHEDDRVADAERFRAQAIEDNDRTRKNIEPTVASKEVAQTQTSEYDEARDYAS